MLLGLGSPFPQARVDLNRLYGTDSSGGTNPFTDPTNANDGNDATHADRASAASSVAIVQSSSSQNTTSLDLGSAVTAGRLLVILVAHKDNPPDIANIAVQSNHAILRPFTAFHASLLDPIDGFVMGYRIASGDEQHLSLVTAATTAAIYELSGFGTPSGYEVKFATGSGSPIVIGSFTVPGLLQIAGISGRDNPTTYAAGAGYTGDYQLQNGPSFDAPSMFAEHGTTGTPAQATSSSGTRWAGMAVGVTAAAARNSWLEADLGAVRRANRMELLESSTTGNTYLVQAFLGGVWTTITATRSELGGNRQRYAFADTEARYWRLVDDNPSGGALSALTWDTWTIEGFPL